MDKILIVVFLFIGFLMFMNAPDYVPGAKAGKESFHGYADRWYHDTGRRPPMWLWSVFFIFIIWVVFGMQ